MKEVEVKIRDIDKQKVIEKVESLGAKKIFTGWVVDFRFDTPERTLSKQGKALRVRQKGKYFYLNLKGKKKSVDNIIDRNEMGVKISNFKTMHKILTGLGYIKIFELKKYRTEYRTDTMTFDIDEYLGLEPILEIESQTHENVADYIKKLGIKEDQMGRVYIREILAARKRYDQERQKRRFSEK